MYEKRLSAHRKASEAEPPPCLQVCAATTLRKSEVAAVDFFAAGARVT